MSKYLLLLIISLAITISGFCQNPHSKQAFIADFIDVYKESSKNNSRNILDAMNTTSKITFSQNNPLYIAALSEIRKYKKIQEEKVVIFLLDTITNLIRERYVWASSENYYKEYKQILTLQTENVCSCLTTNYNPKKVQLDTQNKVFDSCNKSLSTNKLFQEMLLSLLNGKDLNSLKSMQNYFSFNMYEKCDFVYHHFKTVTQDIVLTQYNRELYNLKMTETEKAINFYLQNDIQNLSNFFPKYQNYKNELTAIKELSKSKEFRLRPNYLTQMQTDKNIVILSMSNNNIDVYDYLITFNYNGYNSIIESISKYRHPSQKKKNGEVIDEIRESKN